MSYFFSIFTIDKTKPFMSDNYKTEVRRLYYATPTIVSWIDELISNIKYCLQHRYAYVMMIVRRIWARRPGIIGTSEDTRACGELNSGCYLYTLYIDNVHLQSKRLTVIK